MIALIKIKPVSTILLSIILFLFIALSGVATSYVAFLTRQLHNEIKQELDNKNAHQVIWSKLLLEYSTLTSIKRVKIIATTQLNMVFPHYSECQFVEKCPDM